MINQADPRHAECVAAVRSLPPSPMITTWACLTEAMHLLGRAGGLMAQDKLWEMIARGRVALHVPAEEEWQRMRALMRQYNDAPMDLADASLVAAAESLELRHIFTLDRHFRAYRLKSGHAFNIVP